jgi:hypothetical protein
MKWKKGQSGNPSGRAAVVAEVVAMAQKHGPEAIEALVRLMRNSKSAAIRALAADKLLDRAYGKPAQATTTTVEGGANAINITIRNLMAELVKGGDAK